MEDVKIEKIEERVLAYSLATEISEEELGQVSGGAAGTRQETHKPTRMGGDMTFDNDSDYS